MLYEEDLQTLAQAIRSFLEVPLSKKLYIVDNSPSRSEHELFTHAEIDYKHVGRNCGFGAAHNSVIPAVKGVSKFHLVLNPDVCFRPTIFKNLVKQLEEHSNVSLVCPSVVYPSGEAQVICRMEPSVRELIARRVGIFKKYLTSRQYHKRTEPFSPDFMHGCFMLFKTVDFVGIGGFDERYFLYMEDADICRKLKQSGKEILYYPKEQITHIHRRGSSKSFKLFYFHAISALRYFIKWRK